MPVHPHHAAEGLKPEWVAQPGEKFIVAVMKKDAFRDPGSERRHPRRKPGRHAAAVERQIRNSGTLHNSIETSAANFEEKFLARPIQMRALSDMSHK
jgi:hypothetical protein